MKKNTTQLLKQRRPTKQGVLAAQGLEPQFQGHTLDLQFPRLGQCHSLNNLEVLPGGAGHGTLLMAVSLVKRQGHSTVRDTPPSRKL